MSSISPLRDIHLYGWDSIELTVLSALAAGLPILFTGEYGAAKTEGAYGIAKTILGDNLRWATYECPNIQTDDLVGIPKPSSLNGDVLEFIGTQISVWNVNAVVLDEIGRASRSTVAKLLELVRTRKVYGLDTNILLTFATTNPPSREYHTEKLDPALVSRFVVVEVPGFSSLSREDAEKVLTNPTIGGTWSWWPTPPVIPATDLVLDLRDLLTLKGVSLHGRSARNLQKLLGASALVPVEKTPERMAALVLACLPEAWSITTNHRQLDLVGPLTAFFEQRLGTPLPPVANWAEYLPALVSRIQSCSNAQDAILLRNEIPNLRAAAELHAADVVSMMGDFVQVLVRHLPPPDTGTIYTLPDWLRYLFA